MYIISAAIDWQLACSYTYELEFMLKESVIVVYACDTVTYFILCVIKVMKHVAMSRSCKHQHLAYACDLNMTSCILLCISTSLICVTSI